MGVFAFRDDGAPIALCIPLYLISEVTQQPQMPRAFNPQKLVVDSRLLGTALTGAVGAQLGYARCNTVSTLKLAQSILGEPPKHNDQ